MLLVKRNQVLKIPFFRTKILQKITGNGKEFVYEIKYKEEVLK